MGLDLAEQVRLLFASLSREEKAFLGGPPFTSEIRRELENARAYEQGILKLRSRISLGYCVFDSNEVVIGYQSQTLLNNAKPSQYERTYLNLQDPLNQIQLRKIFVNPNTRGRGVAQGLLKRSLELAHELGKNVVADVIETNISIQELLKSNKMNPQFKWQTRKGTPMIRFSN